MILHTWLPNVLRNAGIKVVETNGWHNRSHGELRDLNIVWHHDASPPGDSPGALGWMVSNWDEASAQCWVDRYGTWYMVGTGVAWHAGRVLTGMPGNFESIGIETDHTTGESWPPAQLSSLRRGTAAILKSRGKGSASLFFHKQIASPPGRKQDPDGLDINDERRTVADLMDGPSKPNNSSQSPSRPSRPHIPDSQVPDLPDALEGDMFWMYAVGRPIVIVVGGKALDLVGLNYDTVKARLVAAGVPEHNLGNEVQLYDRILSVTAR